jgi:hypothetical protein
MDIVLTVYHSACAPLSNRLRDFRMIFSGNQTEISGSYGGEYEDDCLLEY